MTTAMTPSGVDRSTMQETWAIDAAHSLVEFSVKHMMIATVKGRFTDVSGSVTVVGDDPISAEIDVSIVAQTIDSGVPQRDGHLRSADFFHVDEHPTITFRSEQVRRSASGELLVLGSLTIRGVTREVVLTVEELGRMPDPSGSERAAFSATTRIRRRDFGLTWNQILETGGVTVSDEVRISLDVQLVRVGYSAS